MFWFKKRQGINQKTCVVKIGSKNSKKSLFCVAFKVENENLCWFETKGREKPKQLCNEVWVPRNSKQPLFCVGVKVKDQNVCWFKAKGRDKPKGRGKPNKVRVMIFGFKHVTKGHYTRWQTDWKFTSNAIAAFIATPHTSFS